MDTKTIDLKIVLTLGTMIFALESIGTCLRFDHLSHKLLYIGLIRISDIIFILGAMAFLHIRPERIGLSPARWKPGLLSGLFWSLGFGILALTGMGVMVAMGHSPVAMLHLELPTQSGTCLLFFMVGGIISPIAEELFFRGVLYTGLRTWGLVPALLITTLLFAAAHSFADPFNPVRLTGGLIFALAFERTGLLLTPITIHVLGNLALFSLGLL